MKRNIKWALSLMLVMVFASVTVLEDADARAGRSRSSGSSGSRSYSAPQRSSNPATPSQPSSPSSAPAPVPQQPAGGGFLRGMAGGIVGGLLGGMLFSSLGFAGTGVGGSGVGLLEILLLCGIGFFIYSMVKKRREAALSYQSSSPQGNYTEQRFEPYGSGNVATIAEDRVTQGISHIRQMDSSFAEAKFTDTAMDLFFRIQGAWTNRDLSAMKNLLTDEMNGIFKQDIDELLREKIINRLENIAVRKVEIVEVWQEAGQDYIKAVFTANLLDYDTDESTGKVLAGSKAEPVKFEECWTFTRPVGDNPWRLSAISQM